MELTINLKELHDNQKKVLTNQKRFNVLKCGRRWGKTELATDLAVNSLLDGKYVAYYAPTYKDVYETWGLLKNTLYEVIESKDEQVKQIKTITNGTLDIWSMDNPDSGRGRKYHLVIIDECEKALHFKEAWEQAIRATLTDYKGSVWFLSTPKFGKTYFKELFRHASKYDDWAAFKFTSYDNPFIDKEEIDTVKRQLDSLTFRCEFMADDVDLSLNPFAYAFEKEKHIHDCEIEAEYIQLCFDFNVDPITCLAVQSPEIGKLNIIKEFRLENSDIYQLCERIKAAFPNEVFIVTGDATGQNRSAITKGNINYYSVIKQELNLADTQMKQPTINPSVSDTRVLLNSILQNGEIKIDPSCEYLIEDLIYCEVDDKGDIDKTKDKHKTHLLDCLRYGVNTFHKSFLKM